jgi:hypothetical protein
MLANIARFRRHTGIVTHGQGNKKSGKDRVGNLRVYFQLRKKRKCIRFSPPAENKKRRAKKR